ncbi:response regulator [Palleronia sediminis]|uniref:response regulator n=1 Tax=Palleronia sediminis TaxID=2547833 RepID=UPI0014550C18|nr:response regulator [Palleronia sediminis]
MGPEFDILIVEDNVLIGEDLREMCKSLGGRHVQCERSPAGAESAFRAMRPRAALIDINLRAETDGIELAESFRRADPDCHIFFVSGMFERFEQARARVPGATLLVKPVVDCDLHAAFSSALGRGIRPLRRDSARVDPAQA